MRLAWWVLACTLAPVSGALAQLDPGMPIDESPASASDPYGDVLRRAVAAYKAKDWALARELFEEVHGKAPTARTARSLGVVAYLQGRYPEAVSLLEASLASTSLPLTDELRASTLQVLQQAKAHVGQYFVQSEPMPKRVEIEGRPATRDAEGAVLLLPGSHQLTLVFDVPAQEVAYQVPVQSSAGQRDVIHLVVPQPEPVPRVSEAAPPTEVSPPSSPVATRPLSADTTHRSRRRVVGWTLLGTSLVSFGVGTYYGVSSLQAYDRADRACPSHMYCTREAFTHHDLSERQAWIANGTLGAGVVMAIVGGTLLLMERRAERHTRASRQAASKGSSSWAGMLLRGRF